VRSKSAPRRCFHKHSRRVIPRRAKIEESVVARSEEMFLAHEESSEVANPAVGSSDGSTKFVALESPTILVSPGLVAVAVGHPFWLERSCRAGTSLSNATNPRSSTASNAGQVYGQTPLLLTASSAPNRCQGSILVGKKTSRGPGLAAHGWPRLPCAASAPAEAT
jgi:hypothetical protein